MDENLCQVRDNRPINPKFHYRVMLDLYTGHGTKEDFEELILSKILEAEMFMNADGRVRVHASNPTQVFT